MKELRRNMRLVGWLVVALFVGLSAWFAWTAFTQGDIWASDVHNTRLASANALRGNICDIAENPDVAKAVQEEGIGYVLVLDRDGEEGNTIYSNTYDEEEWQGLYSITDETPGFEVALEQDDMRLYRIKPATTTDEQE